MTWNKAIGWKNKMNSISLLSEMSPDVLFDILNETSWVLKVLCLFFILRECESKTEENLGNKVEVN